MEYKTTPDTAAPDDDWSANAMTARSLIELLRQAPADTVLLVALDSEGNEFSPVFGFAEGTYQSGAAGGFRPEDGLGAPTTQGRRAIALYPLT